jgi:acetyl-CoA synthetase
MSKFTPNLNDYEKTHRDFSWSDWHKYFSWKTTGKVNYAYEVTNFQAEKNGNKPAIVSQGSGGQERAITFKELSFATDKFAFFLKSAGFRPGERLALYAPRSVDYAIVLLGAIKAGAIAVPLFEAFGPDAIEDRLNDCECSWIYTNKKLIKNVRFEKIPSLRKTITNLQECLSAVPDENPTVFGDLETPFIIHYTSGSTAKPKGVLLAQRAMLGHLVTAKYVLDLHPEDKYWNTGDPGWVTGMVYNFFAPLLLGVAVHIYEGAFHPESWVNFMKKNGITVWYSTPTAFRLLRYYNAPLNRKNLPDLRHIVSAGEPLNPGLIDWTMENLGIPIHDSWYMTENGHQLINNYRCVPIRKGSMGKCLPGIRAAIIDENAKEVKRGVAGRLAVKTPWPGLMKEIWKNPKKFESYFQDGWYISGDTAFQDEDGYFWFQGREDDMIKTAAERVSPFEVESALVAYPAIAEAGVIGKPHDLYGSIIKAFVILKPGFQASENLKAEIMNYVRGHLSVHETPREIEFVEKLPKTRSGKIMRRVLRARESDLEVGDLSTMDAEMNP